MHPRQTSLASYAQSLTDRTAGDKTAAPTLWKYTCPETEQDFYLVKKLATVKSPYTGKSFTAKAEKFTLGDVGKELKEDAKDAKAPKAKKASELGLNAEAVASEVVLTKDHPALAVLATSFDKVQKAHTIAHQFLAGSGGKVAAVDTIKPLIAEVENLATQAGLVAEQLTARTQG